MQFLHCPACGTLALRRMRDTAFFVCDGCYEKVVLVFVDSDPQTRSLYDAAALSGESEEQYPTCSKLFADWRKGGAR